MYLSFSWHFTDIGWKLYNPSGCVEILSCCRKVPERDADRHLILQLSSGSKCVNNEMLIELKIPHKYYQAKSITKPLYYD